MKRDSTKPLPQNWIKLHVCAHACICTFVYKYAHWFFMTWSHMSCLIKMTSQSRHFSAQLAALHEQKQALFYSHERCPINQTLKTDTTDHNRWGLIKTITQNRYGALQRWSTHASPSFSRRVPFSSASSLSCWRRRSFWPSGTSIPWRMISLIWQQKHSLCWHSHVTTTSPSSETKKKDRHMTTNVTNTIWAT